jgi:hypothetical protein
MMIVKGEYDEKRYKGRSFLLEAPLILKEEVSPTRESD